MQCGGLCVSPSIVFCGSGRRGCYGARFHVQITRTFVLICVSLSLRSQQDCPNGKLTPAKFVDMYKMFFPSGNAEEFCDHVFRTFDMDKNGYIDFKVSLILHHHLLA